MNLKIHLPLQIKRFCVVPELVEAVAGGEQSACRNGGVVAGGVGEGEVEEGAAVVQIAVKRSGAGQQGMELVSALQKKIVPGHVQNLSAKEAG